MRNVCEIDPVRGELYLAGEFVPAGIYRQIGTQRQVVLECEDYLPAGLDGRVACYEIIVPLGKQMQPSEKKPVEVLA